MRFTGGPRKWKSSNDDHSLAPEVKETRNSMLWGVNKSFHAPTGSADFMWSSAHGPLCQGGRADTRQSTVAACPIPLCTASSALTPRTTYHKKCHSSSFSADETSHSGSSSIVTPGVKTNRTLVSCTVHGRASIHAKAGQ